MSAGLLVEEEREREERELIYLWLLDSERMLSP